MVCSLYNKLCQGSPRKHFLEIWRIAVPQKIKIVLWQLIRKRLPSNDNIRRRRGPTTGRCALCDEFEDTNHIFFTCPLARFMWSAVQELLGCDWNPSCFADLYQEIRKYSGQMKRVLWIAFAALVWTLWTTRNKFTIEGTLPTQATNGLYKLSMFFQVWKPVAFALR